MLCRCASHTDSICCVDVPVHHIDSICCVDVPVHHIDSICCVDVPVIQTVYVV